MNKTKIEYLTQSWNPIAMHCTPVSGGCSNCWHLTMAKRLAGNPKIPKNERESYAGGNMVLRQKELEAPLHLKKPSRIGVQFMGDIFHEDVSQNWIDQVLEVIRVCKRHTFLILTKRPYNFLGCDIENLWTGVSVENQRTADERIPILLKIPAAKRFISCEPLLGPVNLGKLSDPNISWVICGGLSLPGGKIQPPRKEWIDGLIHQCDSTGVPMFIKPNAKYSIKREEFPNG